jgi:hypothetical protein
MCAENLPDKGQLISHHVALQAVLWHNASGDDETTGDTFTTLALA